MNDIMLDLETLSTRPDAAILSIGAVYFDINTGDLGAAFHHGIRMSDAPTYGHVCPKTVAFWMAQTPEATRDINHMTHTDNGTDLDQALSRFKTFIYDHPNPADVKIWANGASFDPVVLNSAYQRCNITAPFNHWKIRDVRTIVDLGRDLLGMDPKNDMPFNGTAHNALHDAIHQAKYVSAIYAALKWKAAA